MQIYINNYIINNLSISDLGNFAACDFKNHIYLVKDLTNCGFFYICGLYTLVPCALGMAFDEQIQSCNYPIYVPGCENYKGKILLGKKYRKLSLHTIINSYRLHLVPKF